MSEAVEGQVDITTAGQPEAIMKKAIASRSGKAPEKPGSWASSTLFLRKLPLPNQGILFSLMTCRSQIVILTKG